MTKVLLYGQHRDEIQCTLKTKTMKDDEKITRGLGMGKSKQLVGLLRASGARCE
jgi:hypothetical protein